MNHKLLRYISLIFILFLFSCDVSQIRPLGGSGLTISDSEAVDLAFVDLIFDDICGENSDADNICRDMVLPHLGTNGCEIAWSSNNNSLISESGAIIRPDNNSILLLSAEISKNGVSRIKIFSLTVARKVENLTALYIGFDELTYSAGTELTIIGQVYALNETGTGSENKKIRAQIVYCGFLMDQSKSIEASYVCVGGSLDTNDEYKATFTLDQEDEYLLTFRFSGDNGITWIESSTSCSVSITD